MMCKREKSDVPKIWGLCDCKNVVDIYEIEKEETETYFKLNLIIGRYLDKVSNKTVSSMYTVVIPG